MPRKPVIDPVGVFLLGFGAGGAVMYLLDPSTIVARGLLASCVVAGAAALILRLIRRKPGGRRKRGMMMVLMDRWTTSAKRS
jgi:hypothetical protein